MPPQTKKDATSDATETPVEENVVPEKSSLTDEVAALKAELANLKKDLWGELKSLEGRLNNRIGVVDQKLASPGLQAGPKKPAIGDTVPGVPGKVVAVHGDGTVVTRGEDPQ